MNLKKYNQKRDFKKTKEPYGKLEKTNKKRFCVQHHIASHDHYDFRLEYDGVLLSWAVPKGPSYNPKDKRLAVHVENHPLSYRKFEGIIEEGYGKGTVMLWDEGIYKEIEPFKKTLTENYLKFELFGTKLKGKWTLIKFKEDNWLLIKEKDNIKLYEDINELDRSIKTNRKMEEIKNEIAITNPEKIIYKKEKITKKQIIDYYKKVSNRMLPFLKERYLSTVRAPNGVDKEVFFKKHFDNKFLKKVRSKDYYYIDDLKGLLSEAQMNSIEFHIGSSKKDNIPNLMVFDLDPDTKLSIKKIRDGVKDLKKILDDLKLKAFLKTSGGKGYHIIVPINNKISYQKFEQIAKKISLLMVTTYPEKYTINMSKRKRKNKIFIDYFRNKKGSSFVAPYSLRAREKATISMPIKWSELDKIKPDDITIKEALKRLKRKDPWEDLNNFV